MNNTPQYIIDEAEKRFPGSKSLYEYGNNTYTIQRSAFIAGAMFVLNDWVKVEKPKVVCFCGSTRFAEWFMIKRWELEKQGIITLGINILPNNYFAEGDSHGAEQEGVKDILDELHKRKIDLSDDVYILNVGGYIGESTRNELNYAIETGKQITYLEPPTPPKE